MSAEDDEVALTADNVNCLSPNTIRRIIHGSPSPEFPPEELEWDHHEMDLTDTCETQEVVAARSKRTRDEISTDDSEGFTMVTASKRRNTRHSSPPANSEGLPPSIYEVAVSGKNMLPKQLGFAKLLSNANIQGVLAVTYKNPYKLLIRFKAECNAESFLNNDIIKENEWVCRKTDVVSHTYGVVRDIELDIEDDELKNIFECDQDILNIKRLYKKDEEGKWVKSETIRMCFKGSTLPSFVRAYGCRMKVDVYMYPVSQCSKCWRFGHIRNFCPSKVDICPKCGKDHANCDTTDYKCVNCKGEHMSIVKSVCPAFQRERQIRIYMSQNSCTYKVAVREMNEKKKLNNKTVEVEVHNVHQMEPKPLTNTAGSSPSGDTGPTYRDVCAGLTNRTLNQTDKLDDEINNSNKLDDTKRKKITKTNKKKRKQEHHESEISDEEVGFLPNEDEVRTNEKESKRERKSLFRRILENIKDILLSEDSLENKFKKFITSMLEELKVFISKVFNGDMLLKLITTQNG